MGACCGSASTYGIPPEEIEGKYGPLASKFGSDVLIMSIKDQNVPGKLCFAGKMEPEMISAITKCLQSDPNNASVVQEKDKYDAMWSYIWHNTSLTSGHSTFSLAKSYFPRGKLVVKLLDTIAGFGWGLASCPNMGGVQSRDDKGNVTSCVDWPIFTFYKEPQSEFLNEHLLFAVKDSNIPGKLCAAGPVGDMEARMVDALKPWASDVKSEKDSYDDDYDVVWRNTSITSGIQMMSFAKKYFPKGHVQIALLECAYKAGWRAVCAPNFGGQGDSWPCYVFRKLKEPGPPPELLFASIKDSNIPGKICVSGKSADRIVDATCGALAKIADNASAHSEKDSYDDDHDAVCRDVHVTTGIQAFSFRTKYYPRGDSMKAMLGCWAAEGYQVVACPNFGGMLDSWPSFVLEKREAVPQPLFLAVKDDNWPGKVGLVGGDVASDSALAADLLEVFTALCGPDVVQQLDDYDRTYELAYRNTRLTTGRPKFTFAKPYWPHGYVMELMLQVLYKKGWKAAGGPNFGDDGGTWPGIIFYPAPANAV
mmetsp:Transcript_114090/g.207515  ORF Transcript_114090/g.207515 Transcript_114090/m.207515 type:complete len:537 (+) Transcript_114090:69-1679(+)